MAVSQASLYASDVQKLVQDMLRDFFEALQDESLQFLKLRGSSPDSLEVMLASIKNTLQHAWTSKSADTGDLLQVLAVASRDSRLRPLLGGCFDHSTGVHKSRENTSRDSILAHTLDFIAEDHTDRDDPKVLENALRLVSNCVADINCNRKLTLDKNGTKILLRLAKERQSLNFVIPALYNLCVEFEDPDFDDKLESPTKSRANAAQIKLAHSDTEKGTIKALIEVLQGSENVQDDRLQLLSGLIEMVTLTAPEDLLFMGVTLVMEQESRRQAMYQVLVKLLGVESYTLTSYDGETAVSMCTAVLNVIAAPEVKQVLVSEKQMQSLAKFNHIISTHVQGLLGDSDDEADTLANLQQCEKVLLQEFYALSGLPEFAQAYPVDSDFVQVCIERPLLSYYDPKSGTPSLAIAYTILANITTSEETAVQLVHDHRVQEPLQAVLLGLDEVDALYPALGFLARLALPAANKQEIVNCGMLDALQRFCRVGTEGATDWKPAIRIEAITAVRRLISGQPMIIESLYDTGVRWNLREILDLFDSCNDSTIKFEIGRLFVEHFRTVSSAEAQLDPNSRVFGQMIGQNNNLAGPIALLCCEGQGAGAKAEGWFGLGLMTFWTQARAQVLRILQTSRMLEEIGKVADADPSSDSASADNLKMILSRLDLEEGMADVDRHARGVFALAKQKLGLDT
jgi:hypothetical protein